MKKRLLSCLPLLLCLALVLTGCQGELPSGASQTSSAAQVSLEELPAYGGEPYVELDGNQPQLSLDDFTGESFETYSPLDPLGRCGAAYACIGQDIDAHRGQGEHQPVCTPPAGSQAEIQLCGWQAPCTTAATLSAIQLTGENANEENLITGTRYLNVEGMLPFENLVADYHQGDRHTTCSTG